MLKIFISITFFLLSLNGYSQDEIEAPRLGDTLNKTITLSQELKIGRNIYKNLQNNNYIINDYLVNDYISYLGNKLSRNLSKNRKYLFFITKSKDVNAFAVPGGFIGVNAGLISLTTNEAQLAGVMAHELGHVVLRHSAEMMASSNVNSIPMWIGIFAGLLAGQTQASIASIQSGIGLSVQRNINLVRENEIESDTFAAKLMQKSNFDLNEMANFFRLMQGDSNNQSQLNEYFMTHPLYTNRISTIRNRARTQYNPIKNSTDDYSYVKNILESKISSVTIKNYQGSKNDVENHRIALDLFNKGSYQKAKNILEVSYDRNNFNIYISSLMAKILWDIGEKNKAKNVLKKVLSVYPDNNSINGHLLNLNIKTSYKLSASVEKLNKLIENNPYNPESYKLLAEGYSKMGELYRSKLALVNYYDLKGNMKMAFKVIDDGTESDKLNNYQKNYLKKLKNSILCESNPPLEPIFGDKTCN
tara:strand:+ start:19866 stop:21287 length:1422 start_codon:yes stop_codon:yes gene_type:complete